MANKWDHDGLRVADESAVTMCTRVSMPTGWNSIDMLMGKGLVVMVAVGEQAASKDREAAASYHGDMSYSG